MKFARCYWIKGRAKFEVFQAWFGFDSYENILAKNLSWALKVGKGRYGNWIKPCRTER